MPMRDKKSPLFQLDDKENERLVKDARDFDVHTLQQLTPTFDRSIRFQKLYMAQREDKRKPEEKWRANIFVPIPFANTEAKVAQLLNILTSSDPYIQAGPVGERDQEKAKRFEALLDYMLWGNNFRKLAMTTLRNLSIFGTQFWQSRWSEESFMIQFAATPEEQSEFAAQIAEIEAQVKVTAPSWQTDPDEFEAWRQQIMKSTKLEVPAAPVNGPKKVIRYQGPKIDPISIYEMRVDPMVQEMKDQSIVIRRYVRPNQWVMARTKGDNPAYDLAAVRKALDSWDGSRFAQYEADLARTLGYTIPDTNTSNNPIWRNNSIIEEVYRIGNDLPFQVILNEKQIVNLSPKDLPFEHGGVPIMPIRNILAPGFFYGLSDYQQSESLFYEQMSLRNLRLDGVTLQVLPVLTKNKDVTLTDLQKRFAPGNILDLPAGTKFEKAIESIVPEVAYREPYEIKGEVDDAMGIGPAVRGAAANVGRVSATDSSSRLQQALLRIQGYGIQFEEDVSEMIPQWILLFRQFGDSKLRVRMQGMPGDGMVSIPRNELMDALHMNLRFTGTSRATNRELVVQQLTAFSKEHQALLSPKEARELMRRIYENTGLKGVDDIVSEEVTQILQEVWTATQKNSIMQLSAPPPPPVPSTVSGGAAEAVANAGPPAAAPAPAAG